jgi:hypothetical protein
VASGSGVASSGASVSVGTVVGGAFCPAIAAVGNARVVFGTGCGAAQALSKAVNTNNLCQRFMIEV